MWGSQKVGEVGSGGLHSQSMQCSSSLPFWGDEQQIEGTSPCEWLLRKTEARLLSSVTQGTLQNTGLSERSQSRRAVSVQFHVQDTLEKAQGTAAGIGDSTGHKGVLTVMEITHILIRKVVP